MIALHTIRIVAGMPDQTLIDAFGKRIRTLRTARGLSQEQLAELTGFHRTYIEMIEFLE
jgi:ribosome-binding protein aMBF1 (putative translation factor)